MTIKSSEHGTGGDAYADTTGRRSPSSPVSMGVRTRVVPPRLPVDYVARPRLLAALDPGPSGGLTLLVAPAGFGKTTTVAAWAAWTPRPVAWLTISEAERETVAFIDALVASIRTSEPDFGESLLAMREMADLPEAPVIAAALAAELADLPDAVTLVLDDSHRLDDSPAQQVLAELVPMLPDDTRLIVATRRRPAPRNAQLRGPGQLVEIGPPELRFQPADVRDYLRGALDGELSSDAIDVIVRRTEGWPAGVGLVAQILREQGNPDTWVARWQHEAPPEIRDYLFDELLAVQPPTTQTLLLRTAIVDRMCSELCDVLLGDSAPAGGSQAVLEELERTQRLLQPLDAFGQWYRVPDAFRDTLAQRLQTSLGPQGVAELHRRASTWFAAHDLTDEAIEHALAAGDHAGPATLVERSIGPAVELGDFSSIRRRLERLPSETVETRPRLLLGRAWVLVFRARYEAVAATLDRFEALLERNEKDLMGDELTALRAEASAVLTGVAATMGDGPRLMELARRAYDHLPPRDGHARARAQSMIGIAYHLLGDTDAGLRFLETAYSEEAEAAGLGALHALWGMAYVSLLAARPLAAREAARRMLAVCPADNAFVRAWMHLTHGQASYELGRLAEAREHFLAVDQLGHAAPRGLLHTSLLKLARIEQLDGNVDEAWTTLQAVEALPDVAHSRRLLTMVHTVAAQLAFETGDFEAARSWLHATGPSPALMGLESFSGAPTLTRARLLAATGDDNSLDEAAATLDALGKAASSMNDLLLTLGVEAVRGLLCQARGDLDAALHHVGRAVALAAPGGLVRTFVDLGPPMHGLLAELAQRSEVPDLYVVRLLAAFPPRPALLVQADLPHAGSSPDPDPIEALTRREAEILQLLEARLSIAEIAVPLGLSTDTVKRHTQIIYRKLMIGTRRAAIVRARTLGLLTPAPPGPMSGFPDASYDADCG
jgi:LuxR family maltose regulon positive regulatory protein